MDIATGLGLLAIFLGLPLLYIWAIQESERRGYMSLSVGLESIGILALIALFLAMGCYVQPDGAMAY